MPIADKTKWIRSINTFGQFVIGPERTPASCHLFLKSDFLGVVFRGSSRILGGGVVRLGWGRVVSLGWGRVVRLLLGVLGLSNIFDISDVAC